ncbi:hypothetical protein JZ751_009464 [Albula glossodonta]|uniref:C-type lectin domain-containing protein n=1 Tax=Albula glossodonta TaxID=121402 RepID=A0A8T2NXQ8_9TELE|nr:hypothetical protein JZ751_009464 [Albula glossodonta]
MELEEIKTKEERAKENEYESQEENTKSGGEDKVSVDTAGKGESVYSKLQSRAEDIYSATSFPYVPLQNVKVRTYMRCDPGWKQFERSCFYFARGWKTWAEGREECKKKGGDLAIIDNKNLQEFLTKNGNLAYWIGLTQADSGEYVWINNVAVGQSYWSQSKREGKCGFLIGKDPPNRSWSTAECSHNTAYICQKEA